MIVPCSVGAVCGHGTVALKIEFWFVQVDVEANRVVGASSGCRYAFKAILSTSFFCGYGLAWALQVVNMTDLLPRTFTSADLLPRTFTSADLHLHTFTSADLLPRTFTSADLLPRTKWMLNVKN